MCNHKWSDRTGIGPIDGNILGELYHFTYKKCTICGDESKFVFGEKA